MDTRVDTALERVVARLGAHARELQDAGVRRLSVFGIDEAEGKDADIEIDVAAELDPAAKIDLVSLSGCCRALYRANLRGGIPAR